MKRNIPDQNIILEQPQERSFFQKNPKWSLCFTASLVSISIIGFIMMALMLGMFGVEPTGMLKRCYWKEISSEGTQ